MTGGTGGGEQGAAATRGPRMLSLMNAGIRTLHMYPADNQAVEQALSASFRSVRGLLEEEGNLNVWMAGDFLYVNDQRLRIDLSDFAKLSSLREQLRSHGVGRMEVETEVEREEWRYLLARLSQEPEAGTPPLNRLRSDLEEAGITHIHLGPPAPLFGESGFEEETMEAARRTYAESVRVVRDMMEDVALGRPVKSRKAQRSILTIVDRVLQDRASMLCMTTLRGYDDRTYLHSVNVAILSVAVGEMLGFEKRQLFELGLCGMFHDIGKLLIPKQLLEKEGWLTDEEWEQMSRHPELGLLLLFQMRGPGERPYRQMLTAYEHHMRPDLSGYPEAIRVREQGLFARLVAVCETYDAMVLDTPGPLDRCTPDRAIQQIREAAGRVFDRVVVKAFVNLMGLYPVGTVVLLDSGETAVVVSPSTDPGALHRPLVRIIADEEGRHREHGPVIDLSEADPESGEPRRKIVDTIDPQEHGIRVGDFMA